MAVLGLEYKTNLKSPNIPLERFVMGWQGCLYPYFIERKNTNEHSAYVAVHMFTCVYIVESGVA